MKLFEVKVIIGGDTKDLEASLTDEQIDKLSSEISDEMENLQDLIEQKLKRIKDIPDFLTVEVRS